ncbi:MAG: phage tail tape measure protein [Clostridium sp.]|nr:phage tail tape measure protein [Clostridium sp.]
MANIQASVQLFDGMSPVLKKMESTVIAVSSSLQSMSRAFSRAIDTVRLNDAVKQLGETEAGITKVEKAVENAKKQNDKLNQGMAQGNKEAQSLKKTWGKISGILKNAGINVGVKEILSGANDKRAAGNTLQAQTGMQGDTLDMAKQSMENLYVDNVGASLDDVAKSMSTVYQLTGRTGAELEQTTRAGILLRDTFGYDIAKSMKAAEIMENQFGISGAQAFDLIVQGAQAGLDKNGNLLDAISGYAAQFKKLGFDSTEMFNMLINGTESGSFSVDKLGNTIKEFSTRATDGSKTTREGFEAIGLNADKMAAAFGTGGTTAKQAFQQTIEALSKMDDPVKRNVAGADLFGAMWKDLGYEGVMALAKLNGSAELTTQNLEELNYVKYDDAKSALASLGRTINMGLSGVVGSAVDEATRAISDFTAGLQGDSGQIQGIFGGIGFVVGSIGRAISDGWSIIEPILWGVIAALGVYYGTQLIVNGITVISRGLQLAMAAAQMAYAAMTGTLTAAKAAEIVAQNGVNASMYACPITWLIIGIIALIAIFYAVIAIINKLAGTSISATGLICGTFMVAGAVIGNAIFGILNFVIGIVIEIYNLFATFANFFGNVFNDPVGSILNLFSGMFDFILGIVQSAASLIDTVLGTDLAGAVEGFRNNFADKIGEIVGDQTVVMEKLNAEDYKLDRLVYSDSWDAGYSFGEGMGDKIGGTFDSFKDLLSGMEDNSKISDMDDGIYNTTGDTAANTAAMADSMNIMDEDLKYMRDAAEQEIINRFTLAELKVDVSNNNKLTKKADFEDMGSFLSTFTGEFLAAAAEGGHF